jgi:hypothetical protein
VGLDAVMYIRFIKVGFQLSLAGLFIILPILLPINYSYSSDVEKQNNFTSYSIASLKDRPQLLWVHYVLISLFTLFTIYLIHKNSVDFVRLRRLQYMEEVKLGNPRCRTVMITHLPQELQDDQKFVEYFENMGLGAVQCTQLIRYPTKLIEYLARRKKALLELEIAHIQLAKNFLLAIQQKILTKESFESVDNVDEYYQCVNYLNKIKNKKPIPLPITQNDLNPNVDDPESGKSENDYELSDDETIWDVLARINPQLLDPFQPEHRTKYKTGKLTKSVDYWLNKLGYLDRRIFELRDPTRIASRFTPSRTGFVTFSQCSAAQLCAQSIIHADLEHCRVSLAPEPKDILWKNHTVDWQWRYTRKILVNIAVWTLFILWFIPTAALLQLASLSKLADAIPALRQFLNNNPVAESLLTTAIPATLLGIVMSILPNILFYITSAQTWKTYFAFETSVALRYHFFTVFSVIFVFVIGGTVFPLIFSVLQGNSDILKKMADNLPQTAPFFMNYVLWSIAYQFMELIQVGSPFVLYFLSWLFPKSPRERKRLEKVWSFPFFYYIPNHMIVLFIDFIFAIINPILLLPSVVFFGVSYIIFKNQFIYVYIKRYEANGKHWHLIVRFITDGLILSHLFLIGVSITFSSYSLLSLNVIMIIVTFYYKFYYNRNFYYRSDFVPLQTLKRADVQYFETNTTNNDPEEYHGLGGFGDIRISMDNETRKLQESLNLNMEDLQPITEDPNTTMKDSHFLRQSFNDSRMSLALPNENNEQVEEGNYLSYAFLHPAFFKTQPQTMTLPTHPLKYRYDPYVDVVSVDTVLTSTQNESTDEQNLPNLNAISRPDSSPFGSKHTLTMSLNSLLQ